MSAYLSQQGLIVPAWLLKQKFGAQFNTFLQKLTLVYKPKIGKPQVVKLYEFKPFAGTNCIIIPRGLIPTIQKLNIPCENLLPAPSPIKASLTVDLFANQQLIINYLMQNIFTQEKSRAGTATTVLNLRAGQGKTFIAAGIIDALKLKTLYVVPKCPLAVQAVRDLRSVLCNENAQDQIVIGRYGRRPKKADPSTRVDNQDVTVIVINSAIMLKPEFFAKYSLIIFDEIHTLCSDKRRAIFRKCVAPYVLGMSATTEQRKDQFDPIYHKELAGVIRAEDIPGFTYEDVKFTSQVHAIYYNGPDEFVENIISEATGKISSHGMLKQFLCDPYRMRLCAQELRRLYEWRGPNGVQQHCIYVFCEYRDSLQFIYDELRKQLGNANIVVPELSVGEFIGGIKDQQINAVKSSAQIILTTYGYSSTGISIDRATAILFLTSRREGMLQTLARILRRGGDLSITRQVIDIIDNRTPMRYQYGSRALAYEFYGMEIIPRKVKYTSIE